MGWSPLGIALARLGLAKETKRVLDLWPTFWQFYCNGWGHYGPMAIMKGESSTPFRTSHMGVRDASLPPEKQDKSKFSFGMWPFRHMGMEAMSVLATIMNETLLQSHNGTIHVGPAVTKEQNARFTLHAQDGFIVSAEIEGGRPAWICVASKLGRTCRIENPWSNAVVYENGKKVHTLKGKTLQFSTAAGNKYMIVPDEKAMKHWKTVSAKHPRNEDAKIHPSRYAILGLPRMY